MRTPLGELFPTQAGQGLVKLSVVVFVEPVRKFNLKAKALQRKLAIVFLKVTARQTSKDSRSSFGQFTIKRKQRSSSTSVSAAIEAIPNTWGGKKIHNLTVALRLT